MKIYKNTTIVLTYAFLIHMGSYTTTNSHKNLKLSNIKIFEVEDKQSDLQDLVYALIQVESTGRDNITGDHHLGENYAAGALQIRPVMLREVNRILILQKKSKRFKLSDRYDRQKSIEMFHIWREYHHQNSNFEKIVRSWNGGPTGYLRESTKHHWIKTQVILAQK
jgi:hypothetical protein